MRAADEVIAGQLDGEFPLVVWQTGSGTQTNMNVNEVIANRAIELARRRREAPGEPVHPNDDVNMSASPRTTSSRRRCTSPRRCGSSHACCRRCGASRDDARRQGARSSTDIVKIGRTHLQDATPLTLGQEFSGYVAQLDTRLAHARGRAAATLSRAGHRRHRRRHRPERAPGVRRARRGRKLARADRPAVRRRAQQVRGARRARRAGVRSRRAQDAGRRADEDRQRHPLAGLRAALRAGRAARCRRTSPAPRSCPARSTPRSARP